MKKIIVLTAAALFTLNFSFSLEQKITSSETTDTALDSSPINSEDNESSQVPLENTTSPSAEKTQSDKTSSFQTNQLTVEEHNNIILVTQAVMAASEAAKKTRTEIAGIQKELSSQEENFNKTQKSYDDLKYKIRTEQNNQASEGQKNLLSQMEELLKLQQNNLEVLKTRLEIKETKERVLEEETKQAGFRSAALNDKILNSGKSYSVKAQTLLTHPTSEQTSIENISLNEQRKKSIISVRKDTVKNKEKYKEERTKILNSDAAVLASQPFEDYQKDENGDPLPLYVNERAKALADLQTACNADFTAFETSQNNVLFQYESQMKTEIALTNSELAKKKTITSLDSAGMLSFSSYDGHKIGWDANIMFTLGGQKIAQYTVFLPYKKITGKSPKLRSLEYRDNVDIFDSFFRTEVPYVYAEVEYSISPAESWNPSTYTVTVYNTNFYNIETGKKILSSSQNLTGTYKVLPVNDIRSEQEIKRDDKITSQMQTSLARKFSSQEKAMQKKLAFSNKVIGFLSTEKHGGAEAGIAANFNDKENPLAFTVQLSVPVNLIYLAADLSINNVKFNFHRGTLDKESGEYSSEAIIDNSNTTYDLGLLIGMHFSWFEQWMSPYLALGGGITIPQSLENKTYFLQVQTGIHLAYAANLIYNYRYCFQTSQAKHSLGISIGATGPWK